MKIMLILVNADVGWRVMKREREGEREREKEKETKCERDRKRDRQTNRKWEEETAIDTER